MVHSLRGRWGSWRPEKQHIVGQQLTEDQAVRIKLMQGSLEVLRDRPDQGCSVLIHLFTFACNILFECWVTFFPTPHKTGESLLHIGQLSPKDSSVYLRGDVN